MPAQSLSTEAFVLSNRPPTDQFQAFTLFSVGHGALHALQRLAKKKPGPNVPLDLFDEVALLLESSNQGRTWFVKEAALLVRHPNLGRSYGRLRQASALGALIARNTVPEESRAAVADLLRQALAALAASTQPDLVYFKSLYRFARDEGYPVGQHWLPTLPRELHDEAKHLLHTPLADLEASPIEHPKLKNLQRRLEDYLRGHTEILLE